jgi:hypothetical protein
MMKLDWIIDLKVYASILEEEFPLDCCDIVNNGVIPPGTHQLIVRGFSEQNIDDLTEKVAALDSIKILGVHRLS